MRSEYLVEIIKLSIKKNIKKTVKFLQKNLSLLQLVTVAGLLDNESLKNKMVE